MGTGQSKIQPRETTRGPTGPLRVCPASRAGVAAGTWLPRSGAGRSCPGADRGSASGSRLRSMPGRRRGNTVRRSPLWYGLPPPVATRRPTGAQRRRSGGAQKPSGAPGQLRPDLRAGPPGRPRIRRHRRHGCMRTEQPDRPSSKRPNAQRRHRHDPVAAKAPAAAGAAGTATHAPGRPAIGLGPPRSPIGGKKTRPFRISAGRSSRMPGARRRARASARAHPAIADWPTP